MRDKKQEGAVGTFFHVNNYFFLLLLAALSSVYWFLFHLVPGYQRYQSKIIQRDHLIDEYHNSIKSQQEQTQSASESRPPSTAAYINMLMQELENNKLLINRCALQKSTVLCDQFHLSFTGTTHESCEFVKAVESRGISFKKISLKNIDPDVWVYTTLVEIEKINPST
jgi:hypothetical protein